MSEKVSKFILTVIVGEEQADEVEATMLQSADILNARLTRGDFEPAKAEGYHNKVRSKTLRKQGYLA